MTHFDKNTDFTAPQFDQKIPDFLRGYKLDEKYIINAKDFFQRLKDDPESMHIMCICAPDSITKDIKNVQFTNLSDIKANYKELPKNKLIVFICQMGIKTALLIQFLLEQGFDNVRNLEGGLAYINTTDNIEAS